MIVVLLGIFMMVLACAMLEDRFSETTRRQLFVGIIVLMALFAGFRPEDFDKDYKNYKYLFETADYLTVELSFEWICTVIKLVANNVVMLFVFYSMVSLLLIYRAICRIGDRWWFLALLAYMSTGYLLHCMNQIRVGVSVGLFLLAIPHLAEGRRWRYLGLCVLATFFHYSSIITLPLVLLNNKPLGKWRFIMWCMAIPAAYAIYLLDINVITSLPIPYIEQKFEAYEKLQRSNNAQWSEIYVFSIQTLSKVAITYFLLWFAPLIRERFPHALMYIKVEIIAMVTYIVLYTMPVLSYRVSEFFCTAEIVVFPLLAYTLRPQWVGRGVAAMVATLIFLLNIFGNHLVNY